MTQTADTAVSQYLYLLDQAFQNSRWHSLLGNLNAVTPDDWLWVPPDGRRSIADIVEHVAGAKLMYENQAFGDGKLTWDDPFLLGGDRLATIESATEWLKEAQAHLRESITDLDDSELLQLRMHPSQVLRE